MKPSYCWVFIEQVTKYPTLAITKQVSSKYAEMQCPFKVDSSFIVYFSQGFAKPGSSKSSLHILFIDGMDLYTCETVFIAD